MEDLQQIIQCSATPTTQETGQVYDINISFNKRIDNIDFGGSYTFKLRTEVGLYTSSIEMISIILQDKGDSCEGENKLSSEDVSVTLTFKSEDLNPPVFSQSFYSAATIEDKKVGDRDT